jgi:hypothetical protein
MKMEDVLGEACWKGYHKEGNKKMFGKTYPNCVKNKKTESTDIICEPITEQNILENLDYCVNCGNLIIPEILGEASSNLHKWFTDKWVNIGKKVKGKHPPCGTSGSKSGYAKCVPAAKARRMTAAQKRSAVTRKRKAQNAAGRGGKDTGGSGKKPIYVKTFAKKK